MRDWLFVEDHARALLAVLERGRVGESYLIGGGAERRNIDLVHDLCALLDACLEPTVAGGHASLIRFVEDRPGHDFRYAIDSRKIQAELGWKPEHDLELGLGKTVRWYLENRAWWQPLLERDEQSFKRQGIRRSIEVH